MNPLDDNYVDKHRFWPKADDYENKNQNIKILRMVLIRSHLFS